MLIDSHTHTQFPEFDADRDAVVRRALEAGIWMVNVGTNVESSKKAVELAREYPEGVYATVGIHPVRDEIFNGASPQDADAEYDFAQIEELARDPKVVGIGETGLDYYRSQEMQNSKIKNQNDPKQITSQLYGASNAKFKIIKEKQKELFLKHIELAREVAKPLVIHCREAHDDLLEILRVQFGEVQPPTTNNFLLSGRHMATNSSKAGKNQRAEVEPRGVMHFFGGAGAWENLDEYLKMGFYISLAGVITFKKYGHFEDIKRIPLGRILIETDAPYAAPEPYRGKRNEPLYVKYVAEKLAKIKGVAFEKVAERTTKNARALFDL